MARGALGIVFGGVVGQHRTDVIRQQRAVSEPAQLFQQDAGYQPGNQYRQGYRRNPGEELSEVPAHFMADQQVLRFTDQRTDTAQRGAHGAVHQQAAQEGAELFQITVMQGGQMLVVAELAVLARIVARGDAVIHRVKTYGGTDDHGGHSQGIEERRQKGRQKAEHQGQQGFGADPEQQAREQVKQQVLHEIDTGHHEHQQQDHREVVQQLVVQRLGRGHLQQQGFNQQQPAGHQRIAFECHGQGEDELQHQQPASGHRADSPQDQGIENQKADDAGLVPTGRVPEKVVRERLGH
ncbi:hypothetical protein D3C81_885860 [compost metagenome]